MMLWCSRADMEKIMEVTYVKHRQIMHVKYLCGASSLGTECYYGIDWESRDQVRFLYARNDDDDRARLRNENEKEIDRIIENQGILPSRFEHNFTHLMNLDDVQRFGIKAPPIYEGSWNEFTRARCRNDNLYTSPRIKFDDNGSAAICGCDLLDSIIPIDVCVKDGEWHAKWCVPPTWWWNDDATGDDHLTFESECRLLSDDSLSSCFHQDTKGKGARQWFDLHAFKFGDMFGNISSALTDAAATETDLKVRFQLPTGMKLPRNSRLTKCPPDTLLTVWNTLFARTGRDDFNDSLCTERIAPVLFEHGRPPIGYVERVAPTLRALEIAIGVQDHEPMPKRMRIKIPIHCTLLAPASTATTTTKREYKAWYIPPFQVDNSVLTVGPLIVDEYVDEKDIDHEINRSLESSDTLRGVFLLKSKKDRIQRLTERHFETFRCFCSAAGSRAMDAHANTGSVRDRVPSHKRINVGTPVLLHGCSAWKIVVETRYKHDAFEFRVKDDCGWRKEKSIQEAVYSDAVKTLQDLVDRGHRKPEVWLVDARVPADGRHPSSHFYEIDVGSTVNVELQSSSARSWRYGRPWLSSGGAAVVQGTVVRHDLNTGLYDILVSAKKPVPKPMRDKVVEFHPRDITRVFRGSRTVEVDPRNTKQEPPLPPSVQRFLETQRKVFLCGAYGKIIVKKGKDQGYHWIYHRNDDNISSMRAGCLFACNHATLGVQGTNLSRLKKKYGIDVPKSKHQYQSTKHICDIFETMLAGKEERILSASSTWSHVMDPAFGERKKVVMFYLMELPHTHDDYCNSIQLPTHWARQEPTPGVTGDGVPHCMRNNLNSYGKIRSEKHNPPKPKKEVQAYRCINCRNIPGSRCKVTGSRCVRELQAPNFDSTLMGSEDTEKNEKKQDKPEKGTTHTYSVSSSSNVLLPMCEENSKNDIYGNTYFGYKSQDFFPPSYILRKYDRSIKTIWGHTLQDPERNMWVLVRVRNEEVKNDWQRKHALMTHDDYEKAKRLRRV